MDLPDEMGRVWLNLQPPCLSRFLPKLGCSSDISQKLILCLTPENYDFECVGFTVSQGFLGVANTALTTFSSSSPPANSSMSVYTFLVHLPCPVRMTSERTVQLAGTCCPLCCVSVLLSWKCLMLPTTTGRSCCRLFVLQHVPLLRI